MTIHASKGLEFPIVALANLGTRPRNDIEPVPDRRAHRLHLRVKARRQRVQDTRLRRRLDAREGTEGGGGQTTALRRRHTRPRSPDRSGRLDTRQARPDALRRPPVAPRVGRDPRRNASRRLPPLRSPAPPHTRRRSSRPNMPRSPMQSSTKRSPNANSGKRTEQRPCAPRGTSSPFTRPPRTRETTQSRPP